MANNNKFKTDLITDSTEIIDILRAAIYYNDSAIITYLNPDNEINEHRVKDILKKGDYAPFNHKYYMEGGIETLSTTNIKDEKPLNLSTCRILSIVINDTDRKKQKVDHFFKIERNRNPNISYSEVEENLFKLKYTKYSDSIYNKNTPTSSQLIASKDHFYTQFENKINEYLFQDDLRLKELLKFLLHSFNEFNKYKLPSKGKFKYELLFMNKIQELYEKFPQFDPPKQRQEQKQYFKDRLFNMNPELYSWYFVLKYNISYYNTDKFRKLIQKCRKEGIDEKKFVLSLLKIYSSIELNKFHSAKDVKETIQKIFDEYLVNIKVNNRTIEEYYETAINETKSKYVVLLKRRF